MTTIVISPRTDHRDLVIEELADREAGLLEQIVELTIERDSYRLLAHQSMHETHKQHVELGRLRTIYHRVCDEYRDHRARTMEAA